jgi:hypothetical protein
MRIRVYPWRILFPLEPALGDCMTHPEDPPPILGSWNRIYALVLGVLVLCIALLTLFGRVFR